MYYTHIDDSIGRLLKLLEEQGLRENTLIILTSDHGDFLGQYGLFLKQPNIPYDALDRVPFIVEGAGVTGKRVVETPISLVDSLPTLTELAGAVPPENIQGMSLNPYFQSKSDHQPENHAVFSETEEHDKCVRTHRYN